jgi:hypothetical protein
MLKMAAQQGRSERRGESYSVPYVEPLSDARTMLADFFSILLGLSVMGAPLFPFPAGNDRRTHEAGAGKVLGNLIR